MYRCRYVSSAQQQRKRGDLSSPGPNALDAGRRWLRPNLIAVGMLCDVTDQCTSTPDCFTRYEKGLCRDAWFCTTVSVGLPGKVEVSEDTPLRTVYLAKTGDLLVSVAVGPALDCRALGLRDDEQLKK